MTLRGRLSDAVSGGDGPDDGADGKCRCEPSFVEARGPSRATRLVVDADDCPGDGDLVASPACRATVVGALADRDADVVVTESRGRERRYVDGAAGLLVAAGRFVERVRSTDPAVAARARSDPLAAGREAAGRTGSVAVAAAETGLAAGVERAGSYAEALDPYVGPAVADSLVASRPPTGATLRGRRDLDGGPTVGLYDAPSGPHYHLTPPESSFDDDALATLAASHRLLATGDVDGGERAPSRALDRVVDGDPDLPVDAVRRALVRHTRGLGMLSHLLADPAVSDVLAASPAPETPVRVTVGGERRRTNVRLTPDGAAALASRARRESGSALSRASPTLDAVLPVDGGRVRLAAVTRPVADGLGFALRRHGDDAFRLRDLVANGTLSPWAAGLLSLAVERGTAGLIAGPRGAGKTTLLGACCWAIPALTRVVVVEDTPELPVSALGDDGRDVQPLRTAPDADGDDPLPTPASAIRTALRLGDGALVLGEVRGPEAAALYEAMRVGSGDGAVFGTIHGDGGAAVRERVVSDLDVAPSSFAATDLVVTLSDRRVVRIEEFRPESSTFETLCSDGGDGLDPTGVVDRGESRLLASFAAPGESYADLLGALEERTAGFATERRRHGKR